MSVLPTCPEQCVIQMYKLERSFGDGCDAGIKSKAQIMIYDYRKKPKLTCSSQVATLTRDCFMQIEGLQGTLNSYLLTAQYAIESIADHDSYCNAARQTQVRLHRGQVLTAGFVRNQ